MILKEFKDFINRGSVIDLAVGIIMGAAFTTIVHSLVNDIIMPPIGYLTGGIDFANMYVNLTGADSYTSLAEAKKAGATTVNYGLFINALINFIIVSFAVFLLVKNINRLRKPTANAPAVSKTELLLEEIRDVLKAQDKKSKK